MTRRLFTGIDLVDVSRFRGLNPRIRDRFFTRVFTDEEKAYIGGSQERAAGIFAVKEALVKALGCGIGPVGWHELAIRHDAQGRPMAELSGQAAIQARKLGIAEWSVSISHTRDSAAAVAVAMAFDPPD